MKILITMMRIMSMLMMNNFDDDDYNHDDEYDHDDDNDTDK